VPRRALALAGPRDALLSEPMQGFTAAAVAVFADLAEHSAAERRLRTVREA